MMGAAQAEVPGNVVFDVGGVLIGWRPDLIVQTLYPGDAERQARVRQFVFNSAAWAERFDRGLLDEAGSVAWFAEASGLPAADMQRLLDLVQELLIELPDSLALLRELSAAGVGLYCLSNMPAFTWRYAESRWNFWSLFRGIVISSHIGYIKPEREIYEHLLRQYGLTAGSCVFVDDRAENVAGAEAVGMRAMVFRGAADCRSHLRALGLPVAG